MIECSVEGNGMVLSTGFPPGSVSYLDHDWLPGTSGRVPSLTFLSDGKILWSDEQVGELADGSDSMALAAALLFGLAEEAYAALPEVPRGVVDVVGHGLVAEHVRRLVARDLPQSGDVAAVVDTTGDPETIRAALERVSDLGTVVLAGEADGRRLDLDLYSTVHGRGLLLVGVSLRLPADELASPSAMDEGDLVRSRTALDDVSPGTVVRTSALWHRVAS